MKGKTILITGSTDGIGRQTALELARRGGRIILHGRSKERVAAAATEIEAETGTAVDYVTGDFASLAQVRDMAADVLKKTDGLHVLINNAGTFSAERRMTEDCFELTWQVNHLAPYLLTCLLLERLKNSTPARVVNVASMTHAYARLDYENLQGEKEYKGSRAYSLAKLGNVMATFYLAEKLANCGVTVNCLHPGVVDTKLLRASYNIAGVSPEIGARTSIYLACSPEVEGVTGKYFDECKETAPSPLSLDVEERQRFMDVTNRMLGL
ncbi:MAG: SDR family oxidoreductase [Leptolinea sp.]|jgi:NAD(P)-dependent dehydrogenase (short-subunit alcohol dehydrogenase family)|nr:SDR family oxidoreductase [Leptolinea sp.]